MANELVYGFVTLKDWSRHYDGRMYAGFGGKISIIQDEEIAGFKVNRGESNWIARIEGVKSNSVMYILGCQVQRAQTFANLGDLMVTNPTDYLIL